MDTDNVVQQESPSSPERTGDLSDLIGSRGSGAGVGDLSEFVDSLTVESAVEQDDPNTGGFQTEAPPSQQTHVPDAPAGDMQGQGVTSPQPAIDPEMARRYAEAETRNQELYGILTQVAQNVAKADEDAVRERIRAIEDPVQQQLEFTKYKLSLAEQERAVHANQQQQIAAQRNYSDQMGAKTQVAYNMCEEFGLPTPFTQILMQCDTPTAMEYMAQITKEAYDIRVALEQSKQQTRPQQTMNANARKTSGSNNGSAGMSGTAKHSGDIASLIVSRQYLPSAM